MIREAHVTIGDRKTRYLEAGAGWPVLLIHAFPLNADMWRPQLERVPDGWRFIAPDLRGFGPAAAPARGRSTTTVDDFAGDLVRAARSPRMIDRAVIGGLSMGGYVTFALFRRSPERFSGMILADTKSQADTPEGREGRRKMIELVRASGAAAVADQMLPKLLGATSARTRPELVAQVRQMIESTSAPAIAAALEALSARPDSTPDLAAHRVSGADRRRRGGRADARRRRGGAGSPDCPFAPGGAARRRASLEPRIAGRVLESAR